MKKFFDKIRHNPCVVAGFFVCLVVLLWVYGCESRVRSLKQPHLLVNRSELQLELDTILSEMEQRISDLDHRDSFRNAIFGFGLQLAQGGSVDPVSLALILGNILGVTAVIDNRRKDTVIKTLKNNGIKTPK